MPGLATFCHIFETRSTTSWEIGKEKTCARQDKDQIPLQSNGKLRTAQEFTSGKDFKDSWPNLEGGTDLWYRCFSCGGTNGPRAAGRNSSGDWRKFPKSKELH
jgi:hypothetical protein